MLSVKAGPAPGGPILPEQPEPQTLEEPSTLFVAALTQDSDASWHSLLDCLTTLPPSELRELTKQPHSQHYIHRVVRHAAKHSDRLAHLRIAETLASLFPVEVEAYTNEKLPFAYSYSDLEAATVSERQTQIDSKKRRRRAATVGSATPTKDLFAYSCDHIPATYRGPALKLTDVAMAAGVVSHEMTSTEKKTVYLQPPLRTTTPHGPAPPARGPPFFLDDEPEKVERPFLQPVLESELEESQKWQLSPGLGSSPSKKTSPLRAHFQRRTDRVQKPLVSPEPQTTYNIIEAFATGRLKSGAEAVYLNYSDSVPWNPYSLLVVPKTRINQEYFIISKFGILHVYPDGESDLQSFADWLKEAGLFTLISRISFFRLYLLRRGFARWYRNVRYNQFARIHSQISRTALRFFPTFAEGLLKIQSLSKELLAVAFHGMQPLGSYSPEAFEKTLQGSQVKAQRFLQRYFKYCRRVVGEAVEATQSRALELETEKRHQPFVSELPISIQKEKHVKLEKDLQVAQYRAGKLGEFVTLANQMVTTCLMQWARQSAQSWVDATLRGTATPVPSTSAVDSPPSKPLIPEAGGGARAESGVELWSEGLGEGVCAALLCAELIFGDSGSLTTTPSPAELESSLLSPLHTLTHTLTSTTQPLTGTSTSATPPGLSNRPTGEISPSPSTLQPVSPSPRGREAHAGTKEVLVKENEPHPPAKADKPRLPVRWTLPSKQPKSLLGALKGITSSSEERRPESVRARERLCQVAGSGGEGVEGWGVEPGTSPLLREELQRRMEQDEMLVSCLTQLQSAVGVACQEVGSVCRKLGWLEEMWSFVQHWGGRGKAASLSPEEFQTTLSQLHEWAVTLSHLPPRLPTPHSLVGVATGALVGVALPRLQSILGQLKATGVEHARGVCQRVLQQAVRRSEALSSKRYDLEGFAAYSKQLRECQAFHKGEASNVHYVLKVHSILLRRGVEVPLEDKALGRELQVAWGVLERRLAEAKDFVETQTPVKAQGLQASITSCEDELRKIVDQVNEGDFVVPSAPPTHLLERLKGLQEEAYTVRARLLGLSKWKEAITGRSHDLSSIASLLEVLFVRQELWKYCRVFASYEKEWLKLPFKKLDVAVLSQKVGDWLVVCSRLETSLPSQDPVLEGWKERLDKLQGRIPLLKQLSSKALRTSHWCTIFATLGEDYDPSVSYTLNDFSLYNIYKHSDIIFEICHDAMQEDMLRIQLSELQQQWETLTLSIVQTPLEHFHFAVEATRDRAPSPSSRKSRDKTTTFAIGLSQPSQTMVESLLSVATPEKVGLSLEDSEGRLKVLLASAHVGSLRGRAQALLATLRQLGELISLIASCQAKWQDLLQLFSKMEPALRSSCELPLLQQATAKFQEVAHSIRNDPRVLSLLGKRRGQKGFRELQGEALRQSLAGIHTTMELVMCALDRRLEDARGQFPRLCYLPDRDIVRVLSHRGSPLTLIPLISRVFPSIVSVRFTEVAASSSPVQHIGSSDSVEGFQIIGVEGSEGEPLPLLVPLPLGKRPAPVWLRALEVALRHSLSCRVSECRGTLPEALMGISSDEQAELLQQWLSSHPQQSVLMALELHWTSALSSAISSEEPDSQLKQASSQLLTAVEFAVELLRTLPSTPTPGELLQRTALQNIIITLKHKMEAVRSFLESGDVSLDSFIWKSHIHYSVEGEQVSYASEDENTSKRTSFRSSVASLHSATSSKPAALSVKSSRSSLDQRSHVLSHKLLGSTHSLVASSKSLLSSKQSLLSNELPKVGSSSQSPTRCVVHSGESTLPYGFEYYSSRGSRLVLAPPTEACLLQLLSAVGGCSFPSISGAASAGKTETTLEAAKLLGRHYYLFYCSPRMATLTLTSLLVAALRVGSLLVLSSLLSLPPLVVAALGQLLSVLKGTLAKAFGAEVPSKQDYGILPTSRTPSPHPPSGTAHTGILPTSHTPSPRPPPGTAHTTTRIDWYRNGGSGLRLSHEGTTASVEFAGQTISINSSFGCMLVDCTPVWERADVPDQLKASLRPVPLVTPGVQLVAEALLLSRGFSEAPTISRRLACLLQHIHTQLSISSKCCSSGLQTLKKVVAHAADHLEGSLASDGGGEILDMECQATAQGVMLTFAGVSPEDSRKVRELVESHFPPPEAQTQLVPSPSSLGVEPELQKAILSQLEERHLQDLPVLVEKIHHLHFSLLHHRWVTLVGPRGSGKTTALRILAAAYRHVRELKALGKKGGVGEYPDVDVTVINPAAYSWDELFGSYQAAARGQQWRDGILTRFLRQTEVLADLRAGYNHPDRETVAQEESPPAGQKHWLVLDGPVGAGLVESLSALVTPHGLCLPNGEKLLLPASFQLLVETPSLAPLTPGLLVQCALVPFGGEVVTWEALVDTWLDRAPTLHNLSAMSTETLALMLKQLVPESLEFLQHTNTNHHGTSYTFQLRERVFGILETQCFLNLLSATLERNAPKMESSLFYPSRSSRLSSSQLSGSRASSSMGHAYSLTYMSDSNANSRGVSRQASGVDVGRILDPLEPEEEEEGLSECSLELGLTLQMQKASILAFAYIWSIGAFVPFSELASFDSFARDQIGLLPYQVPLPEEGSVFDYWLDLRQYRFLTWEERNQEKGRGASMSGGYVNLPDLERIAYVLDLYLSYGHGVLLVGEQGTGKTSFVEHLIQSRMPVTRVPITHTLTPSQLQYTMLDKLAQLEKRAGQRLGPGKKGASEKCLFFMDDLHLASHEGISCSSKALGADAAVPVLETVRFAISQGVLLDLTRNYQHDLHSVRYIGSCTPQGFAHVVPSLGGLLNPLPLLPPSDEALQQVFSRSVLLWLQQFPAATIGDAEFLAEAIAAASVTVYRSVSRKLHPSPTQPHLLFTMHDLLHVYEGLLLMSPDTKAQAQPQFGLLNRRGFLSSTDSSRGPRKGKASGKNKSGKRSTLPSLRGTGKDVSVQSSMRARMRSLSVAADPGGMAEQLTTLRMLCRLWCHENTRVYADRLGDSRDRMWFLRLLETCIKCCFCGVDLQAPPTSPRQPLGGHTATQGGRRGRGGRGRANVLPPSEGPSLADLASSGISVDILQKLVPRDPEQGLRKLLPYDQLTMRGEDLTGLMFARFPKVGRGKGEGQAEDSSLLEGEEEGSEGGSGGATPTTTQEGYNELGDGQVTEALGPHLAQLRDQPGWGDMVLFRGAIEHATRLCRVMHLPGCHALLLGSKGTGRKSLTRLVAHVMEAQLFEVPAAGSDEGLQALRSVLREVCISAGLERKTTALLVGGARSLERQAWESVCQLMSEGLCSGLFTSSELLVMSSRLQQSKVKRTAQGAQQAFARAVQHNLHVFVAWDLERGGSPFGGGGGETGWGRSDITKRGSSLRYEEELVREESQRAVYTFLCRSCSHVDYYQPWSRQAFSDVALRWWQQSAKLNWQDWVDTGSQLEAVASLAAHVHLTSSELLSQDLPGLAAELISPSTLMETLRMTQAIAMVIRTKEKATAERLEAVLQKLGEVDHTVQKLERQLAVLRPRLAAAEMEVQQRMGLITNAKERYMMANQRCKTAEETIETETTNVEQLSKIVKEKEEAVSPLYQSSLEALSSVQKNDVLEVMSYREPPASLTPVFDALCMLFDRPKTWEDCKQLLLSQNFFESLKFFDRDNVPRRKLSQLEKIIVRGSPFAEVEHGSRAVVPLRQWVSALVDYHQAKRAVQPFRERLTLAENTLMEANKTFVTMRKDMMETKAALEETVKLHRKSVQGARSIEAEIEAVQASVDQANRLLYTLSCQRMRWEEQLRTARGRMDSVPGHALLCAANTCYLACVPPDRHQELLSNWLSYCSGGVGLGSLVLPGQKGLQSSISHRGMSSQQQQVVRTERDFSLQGLLSSQDETSLWQQESVFPNQTVLERCLAVRACCIHGAAHWPLVFDPNNQFSKYLCAIEAENITKTKESGTEAAKSCTEVEHSVQSEHGSVPLLKCSQPEVGSQLIEAMSKGRTVVLNLDSPPIDSGPLLECVMKRNFVTDSTGHLYLKSEAGNPLPVDPAFRLYIILEHPLGSDKVPRLLQSLGCSLMDFCVANMELGGEGLQSHLLMFTLRLERPEYGVRHKSVLTDLALHQQQADSSQKQIVQCVLDTDGSLLQSTSLITTIRSCENSEASAMEQITETKKILRSFDQQIQVYKPLAEYATSIFNTVQKLSSSFGYYQLGLREFEQFIEVMVMAHKNLKVANNSMALMAHMLHLKNQLLSRAYTALQIHTFGRHQVLLPLLVALEAQLANGKLTREEYQLLGEEGCSVEAQLGVLIGAGGGSVVERPHWVTDQCWCAVLQLQKQVPAFRRLAVDIYDNSMEWREYFQLPPSLLAPVPGMGESLSLGQRLLLWKVFRPNKFSEVVHGFILLTLGSEFSASTSPTITTILPHTSPLIPTLCLLPESDPSTSASCCNKSPATRLKAAAQDHERELLLYPVLDQAGFDDLLSQLPQLAAQGGWVAVEHCHFCPGWQEGLEDLFQVLAESTPDSVHPDFRLWVLLPVDVATGVEFNNPCLRVAFEGDGNAAEVPSSTCGDTKNSQRLLDDIKQVIGYTGKPFTLPQWETIAPLVSKIQAFLPAPLGEEELTALGVPDIQESGHSQSILALLADELLKHNMTLVAIHASLQTAMKYFQGSTRFSSQLRLLLSSIAHNQTPEQWTDRLPFTSAQLEGTKELLTLLKLLKSRVKFYTHCLQSGSLPSSFAPLWFSNPSELLSRSLHYYINTCQLQGEEIVLQAKVMPTHSSDKHQYSDPDSCITLHGLTLHGAGWDIERQCLELQSNPHRTECCSVLMFPVSQEYHSSSERRVLHCPVLMARELEGEPDPRASPLLHVCLEVESAVAVCNLQGRVCLTCYLPSHEYDK